MRRKWSGQLVPSSAKPRRVLRVHEAQDLLVVLNGADEALLLRDLAAQPREDLRRSIARAPLSSSAWYFCAAEALGVAALGLRTSPRCTAAAFSMKRSVSLVAELVVVLPIR